MRLLLLFVAAVIAIFAGVAALQLSSRSAPPASVADGHPQSVSTVDILVARVPIAPGTLITKAMLDTQPWPENLVLKEFIVSGSAESDIVGKVTRSPFQAREPFISNKLANTNEAGFLAARLPAGMHAVTIATDAVSGVAGFVYPGDRIDVLFTHNLPEQLNMSGRPNESRANGDKPAHSEILVSNVPVLAINLRDPSNKDENQPNNSTTVAPSSITLQVSAMDAENIRLAEKVGTLSVSLRSIQDHDREETAITPPADLSGLTHVQLSEAPQPDGDAVKVTRR